MSAFPDNLQQERILFVVKNDFVLVQSPIKPDWDKVSHDVIEKYFVKEIEQNFQCGDTVQFELTANPTNNLPSKGKRGVRRFVAGEQLQLEWLMKKGSANGFVPVQIEIGNSSKIIAKKKNHNICFGTVDFKGYLKVVDSLKFENALVSGIGSAKGMGCGMFMVIKK